MDFFSGAVDAALFDDAALYLLDEERASVGTATGAAADEAARLRRAQRNREAAHRSRAKHKRRQQLLEEQAERAVALHAQLRALLNFFVDELPETPVHPVFEHASPPGRFFEQSPSSAKGT